MCYYLIMGRKRLDAKDKRVRFSLSIKQSVLDELRKQAEQEGEHPSRIIEYLIINYYLNKKD